MSILAGLGVVQLRGGLAAAVCGRLLADVGADVACVDPDNSTLLADYLKEGLSQLGYSVEDFEGRATVI